MPRYVLTRRVLVFYLALTVFLFLSAAVMPTLCAAENATQLFSPFTPMQDPNRAIYALGVLFRANLADLASGEEAQGMVRYPGPLRRLGLRVHAGQQVRILGLDGGLRVELKNGESVEGCRVDNGYTWCKTQ